jgi:AcrR family transcriptional regulator
VPRPFSERERDLVRQRLLHAGRDAFATFGLRRAAVDDLVRAAGISKGAFYLFFDSKEALLLEILEQFEADFQTRLLERVLRPGISPRDSVRELLRDTVAARSTSPLLRRLGPVELDQLMRRVSPERAAALRRADVDAAARFLDHWRARGVALALDAELLTGLLRSLVLASLHESEIGSDVYGRVFERLVDAVAASIVPLSIEEAAHA